MAKRPDWTRPLPQTLVSPDVITLKTLADVRRLINAVPPELRAQKIWQFVEGRPNEAARGERPTVGRAL
jgi:hypothetical protein